MQLGAVAFVLAETILGEARAEVTHHHVARHFCDHAGGGDRQAVTIAVDDRGLREWKGKNRQSVDENVIGRRKERGDGGAHRLVNDFHIARNVDIDFFAQFRCKLFRIVEFAVPKSLRQNDRGGDNWTGQGAAPGFIDPCDAGDTDGAQFLFVTESTAPIH